MNFTILRNKSFSNAFPWTISFFKSNILLSFNVRIKMSFDFPIEICAISKIPKKEIGRCFKLILRTLEASVVVITSGDFMVSERIHP